MQLQGARSTAMVNFEAASAYFHRKEGKERLRDLGASLRQKDDSFTVYQIGSQDPLFTVFLDESCILHKDLHKCHLRPPEILLKNPEMSHGILHEFSAFRLLSSPIPLIQLISPDQQDLGNHRYACVLPMVCGVRYHPQHGAPELGPLNDCTHFNHNPFGFQHILNAVDNYSHYHTKTLRAKLFNVSRAMKDDTDPTFNDVHNLIECVYHKGGARTRWKIATADWLLREIHNKIDISAWDRGRSFLGRDSPPKRDKARIIEWMEHKLKGCPPDSPSDHAVDKITTEILYRHLWGKYAEAALARRA